MGIENSKVIVYLPNKGRIDVDLVCLDVGLRSGWSVLDGNDGPGGVDGVHLGVQLVQLDVSEHMVALPPGHPQLVQAGTHLSGF